MKTDTKQVPQARPTDTDLGNWRTPPHSQWAFQHVRELIPTANIAADAGGGHTFSEQRIDLDNLAFDGVHDDKWTVAAMMSKSDTDAFVVLHEGAIAFEWFRGGDSMDQPHIVFSVSKSITAALVGILIDRGVLDPGERVAYYLPEVNRCVYGECTLRHVLDMTVAMAFEEIYLGEDSDYARYRTATGWNPPSTAMTGGEVPSDLKSFLLTLRPSGKPHGHTFEYLSPNSDLLGWVIEAVTGEPVATLLSRELWQPVGAKHDAYITVDRLGAPRTAGGICATPYDLARFAEMMRCEGCYNDRQIVSSQWLADTLHAGDHAAWQRGTFSHVAPHGRYRNQWYQTGNENGAFFAVGIHGQWLYIDPKAAVTIVKLSTQCEPLSDPLDLAMLRGFDAIAREFQ